MAYAYKCDRCGKLYEKYDGIECDVKILGMAGNITGISFIDRGVRLDDHRIDFCPECCTELVKWFMNPTNMPEPVEEPFTDILLTGDTFADLEADERHQKQRKPFRFGFMGIRDMVEQEDD